MKTAFIIVLYKTPHSEVNRLKREIVNLGLTNYKIYLVDNTNNNRGYAGGVNEGIRQATDDNVDYFVILNPDVSLPKSFGKHLLDGKKHFDIWGGVFTQNGKTYYGGELDERRMSGGLITVKPDKRFAECDFVSGSCMIIPKTTIDKIGLLDESFFLYYEDVEYCLRAKRANLRVGVDSDLTYEHFESSDNNPSKDWMLAINRLKIMQRYSTKKQKIYELLYLPKTAFSIIKAAFKRKSFLPNFISLNISSILTKILSFLLFIFLVRILPVHDYGRYTLVWAHVAILMPILDMGTTTYSIVNLPTQKENAFVGLFNLRWLLAIIVFISTITLSILFRFEPIIILYVTLTSIVIFSNSLSGSVLIKSSVNEKIYIPSLIGVIFQAILDATLITTIIIGNSLSWLFVATSILYGGYGVFNYILLNKLFGEGIRLTFFPTNWGMALSQWRKIIAGSYVYVLIGFFAGLYYGIDVFLLKWLRGVEAVGIYSAGYKFFDAMLFIAASYNFTATPRLSRLYHDKNPQLMKKIKSDISILVIIGLFVVLSMWSVGEGIIGLILKGDYVASIEVLHIVILALPFLLLTSVFLNMLYVLGKQKWVIYLFVFQTCLNILLNIILIPHYSYFASAYITVLCEMLNTVVTGIMFYVALKAQKI